MEKILDKEHDQDGVQTYGEIFYRHILEAYGHCEETEESLDMFKKNYISSW